MTSEGEITVCLPMELARKVDADKDDVSGKLSAFYMVWYVEPAEAPAPAAGEGVPEGMPPIIKQTSRLPTKLMRANAAHSGRDQDVSLQNLQSASANSLCPPPKDGA